MLEFCTERRALFSCEMLALYEHLLPITKPVLTYILHRQYFLCHYSNLILTDNIFQNTLLIFQNQTVSSMPQPHQRWLTTDDELHKTRRVWLKGRHGQAAKGSARERHQRLRQRKEGRSEGRKEGRREQRKMKMNVQGTTEHLRVLHILLTLR